MVGIPVSIVWQDALMVKDEKLESMETFDNINIGK